MPKKLTGYFITLKPKLLKIKKIKRTFWCTRYASNLELQCLTSEGYFTEWNRKSVCMAIMDRNSLKQSAFLGSAAKILKAQFLDGDRVVR